MPEVMHTPSTTAVGEAGWAPSKSPEETGYPPLTRGGNAENGGGHPFAGYVRPRPPRRSRAVVYVSGPITLGDQAANIRAGIDAADRLMRNGFAPICPQLSHFWHMVHPHSHDEWMAIDLAFVEASDAVVRLPGQSRGADLEVEHAQRLGIPVYFGTDQLFAQWPAREVRGG